MKVQHSADHDFTADYGADLGEKIALTVVDMLRSHRAVKRQEHYVYRAGSPEVFQDFILERLIDDLGRTTSRLGMRRQALPNSIGVTLRQAAPSGQDVAH